MYDKPEEQSDSISRIADAIEQSNIIAGHILAALDRIAQSLEQQAGQMPALIEAAGKRGGGGNWSGKEGKSYGLVLPFPDKAILKQLEANSTFTIPVAHYRYDPASKRISFFAPFDKHGNVMLEQIGLPAGQANIEAKSFVESKSFKAWQYDPDGQLHHIVISGVSFKVLPGKEGKDPFTFPYKIEALESQDPATIIAQVGRWREILATAPTPTTAPGNKEGDHNDNRD